MAFVMHVKISVFLGRITSVMNLEIVVWSGILPFRMYMNLRSFWHDDSIHLRGGLPIVKPSRI